VAIDRGGPSNLWIIEGISLFFTKQASGYWSKFKPVSQIAISERRMGGPHGTRRPLDADHTVESEPVPGVLGVSTAEGATAAVKRILAND